MTQTLLNKALDGLAMAHLAELAAQLQKENLHTSAQYAAQLAEEFRDRIKALAPIAQAAIESKRSGIITFYGPDDPIMYDLERCAVLAGFVPDLAFVEDLITRLDQRARPVALVWVEYARDRVGQFHAAICAVWDMASRLVPPVDQFSSDHRAMVGAYNVLNHIGGAAYE
jgi:hypothetical protein